MADIRFTKILATLGPASSNPTTIRALIEAGANVFRLNFSHGSHQQHREVHAMIRSLEAELERPIGILMDLQGPKLRLGTFAEGKVTLAAGARIRFDLDPAPGDARRVCIPHPEIIGAVSAGHELLVDDGKMRLTVVANGEGWVEAQVQTSGVLSDRKGVNVPSVTLPLSAMTNKDRADLDFGLRLGVDWVALSFVQRPQDLVEARRVIGDRALLMAKVEKPAALACLDAIIAEADGIMVARGDLGVELPPEEVPVQQKRIVSACREAGKPVVIATQMLESMITGPSATRAEVSDVAAAVFDGVDAVMLSAESASGAYPCEAVAMMARIIRRTEADPLQRKLMEAISSRVAPTSTDAVGTAIRAVSAAMPVSATVAFTASGATTLRIANQRPRSPVVSLSPRGDVAARLTLVWGVRSRRCDTACAADTEMVAEANAACHAEDLIRAGHAVLLTAGVPFGTPGTTNLMRVVWPD